MLRINWFCCRSAADRYLTHTTCRRHQAAWFTSPNTSLRQAQHDVSLKLNFTSLLWIWFTSLVSLLHQMYSVKALQKWQNEQQYQCFPIPVWCRVSAPSHFQGVRLHHFRRHRTFLITNRQVCLDYDNICWPELLFILFSISQMGDILQLMWHLLPAQMSAQKPCVDNNPDGLFPLYLWEFSIQDFQKQTSVFALEKLQKLSTSSQSLFLLAWVSFISNCWNK